jgi:DNA repair photolyase
MGPLLFPDLPPPSGLVGIAKLAAAGELLEAKRRVEYSELPTRTYISRCASPRMPFRYMINPYRGCEFGCKYCYARYTHEFMELRGPEDFEVKIFAKEWDRRQFRSELVKLPKGEAIAIGTATDPYQPAERRYGITRAMLEEIVLSRGHAVWIATKSDLVARDADVLKRIAERNEVHVNMTVTTADGSLARLLEPYAPRPAMRFEAVRKLTAAGIPCGVLCCPVIPLINDSQRSIDAVAQAAADAGARSMHGQLLFLKPCAKRVFLPFLEAQFPHLVRRYRERYARNAYLSGEYPEIIAKRVQSAKERFGLISRKAASYRPDLLDDQLSLFNPAQEL